MKMVCNGTCAIDIFSDLSSIYFAQILSQLCSRKTDFSQLAHIEHSVRT